jgi:hypothetical protein
MALLKRASDGHAEQVRCVASLVSAQPVFKQVTITGNEGLRLLLFDRTGASATSVKNHIESGPWLYIVESIAMKVRASGEHVPLSLRDANFAEMSGHLTFCAVEFDHG